MGFADVLFSLIREFVEEKIKPVFREVVREMNEAVQQAIADPDLIRGVPEDDLPIVLGVLAELAAKIEPKVQGVVDKGWKSIEDINRDRPDPAPDVDLDGQE